MSETEEKMKADSTKREEHPYKKPRFSVIPLVAQEVLGVGCKTGPDYFPPDVDQALGCGIANNCVDAGS